jgi:NTP pyrophosphatase (non-canonical NTP hydrolase)
MNFEQYQQQSLTTLNSQLTREQVIFNCAFGIIGETGEVTDFLKKQLFHQMRPVQEVLADPMIQAKIGDELGDLTWYIAVLASTLNVPVQSAYLVGADSLENELLYLSTKIGRFSEALNNSDMHPLPGDASTKYIQTCLGDIIEEIQDLGSLFRLTFDNILLYNVEKLRARHPEGFTSQYTSDSTPR